jgi:SNF2 family DNA or RNA helicase
MPKIPPLFAHQQQSVDRIAKCDRILDTSDPGTGKTRVQIEAYRQRIKHDPGKALIIAPKTLLESAWEDDIKKFAPELVCSVARASNREKAFQVPADVYITNTDAANWLAKQKPAFFASFHTLIIDEISTFKHKTSQRSKAVNKIKKFFRYRAGLTGTPNANSIVDVWHPAFLIDDGVRLGTSFYQFRAAVCEPVQVGPSANMLKWQDKEGAELSVSQLLSDITVRHKFEECLSIPPNHTFSVNYALSAKQRRAYTDMERVGIALTQSNEIVTAVNAASVATKLLQIASGAVYNTEPDLEGDVPTGQFVNIDTGRYELVGELVEDRKHSIVFFNWIHQRNNLIAEFERRGIKYVLIDGSVKDSDRKKAVDEYQAGFYQVLLAHPQSAAHGLTLTKGTTTIWASPTYNLEHFVQGNRRIYRATQKLNTETIVIIAKNTIEETVYQKLMDKDARQLTFLDLMKSVFGP